MWIHFSINQKVYCQNVQYYHWHCVHGFAKWTQIKGNICSYYHPSSSSSLNNSSGVTIDARSLLEREKRENKERRRAGEEEKKQQKKTQQLYFSQPILSILIRVSSAKPSGVRECMEAISTPCGRSQMPLISSWRLIHSDCERSGWSHWPPHANQESRHHGGNMHPPPWDAHTGKMLMT